MPSGASKARPARVNIVISDGLKGRVKNPELPFKVLVVDDLTLRSDSTPVDQREIKNIDKTKFNEVMASYNLSLTVSVPDRITGTGEMPVTLRFNNLDDFRPESIVRQVPELRKLQELRNGLLMIRGGVTDKQFQEHFGKLLNDPAAAEEIKKLISAKESASASPPSK